MRQLSKSSSNDLSLCAAGRGTQGRPSWCSQGFPKRFTVSGSRAGAKASAFEFPREARNC